MKNKKVLNKKISTELGVGIVLLVAVIIGSAFYFNNKKGTSIAVIKQLKQTNKQTPSINDTQQALTDSKDPFVNFSISDYDKWKTYNNKNIRIEMKYPPELYLSSSDGKIIFDYLNPNNPSQKAEGSILTKFIIFTKQETLNQYDNENKLATLQNFKDEKIQLNNTIADKITYTDAFAGGIMYKILIQNGTELVIIDYAGGNKLEDTFNKMLSTVAKI